MNSDYLIIGFFFTTLASGFALYLLRPKPVQDLTPIANYSLFIPNHIFQKDFLKWHNLLHFTENWEMIERNNAIVTPDFNGQWKKIPDSSFWDPDDCGLFLKSNTYDLFVCNGYLKLSDGDNSKKIAFPPNNHLPWKPSIAIDTDSVFFVGTSVFHSKNGDPFEIWSDTSLKLSSDEVGTSLSIKGEKAILTTTNGRLWISNNRGVSWRELPNLPTTFLPTSIVDVDDFFLIGGSGYDGPAVYKTKDGITLTDWSDGLPKTLVISMTLVDQVVYAATESGAFLKHRDTKQWLNITHKDIYLPFLHLYTSKNLPVFKSQNGNWAYVKHK